MKLLWLCNMIPGKVSEAMGKPGAGGLWTDHVLSDLMQLPELELSILCRSDMDAEGTVSERVGYYLFAEKVPEIYYPELEEKFRVILESEQPDVIHIWGTEFGHTLAMMRACKATGLERKAIISIQGLCSTYAQHYNEGIPEREIHRYTLRDYVRRGNLAQQADLLAVRGQWETEALRMAYHVIGRTPWDWACTNQINTAVHYHFCNETMRDPFYSGGWNYDSCRKHSIFVPNWTDPRKGFHYVLQALAIVREQFPDAQVYVPGTDYYPGNGKERLRRRAHWEYLTELTQRLGLKNCVHFLGRLSAEQMKQEFCSANVFVLASSIENSPNALGEAMLLGVPCVAADVGGVSTMLVHKQEGFVYQSTAQYMLAHYIMEVFRMGKSAETMGEKAQLHARKTHDPQTNLRDLLNAYRDVMQETNR